MTMTIPEPESSWLSERCVLHSSVDVECPLYILSESSAGSCSVIGEGIPRREDIGLMLLDVVTRRTALP